jgi:hypothetical protein
MHKLVRAAAVAALGLVVSMSVATASRADWMAYAVDGHGKLGHGRARTPEQAQDYALGYCGSPRCFIVMTSRARCVALASSDYNGFWVGTGAADTSQQAAMYARRYCAEHAPWRTCHVKHTYCQ